MKVKILIFIISCCMVSISNAQVSLRRLPLENGEYIVGFKHYISTDSTRTYRRIFDWINKTIARPIPISIWYPSGDDVAHKKPLTVLDYMQILKEEEEWEYLPNEQILNWFYYANTPENQRHLKETTRAYSNLHPIPGKFPAVIYAPSYQASSIENFAICEYLASNGYIVISSPSRGSETRFLDGGVEKDMETQARDIEFLIKEISGYKNVDHHKIAAMGFSFGGLSNVLVQMRNSNIKAIVSLDGSIKYQYTTLLKSPFSAVRKVDVPFMHMAQKNIPREVMVEDKIDTELNYKFEFYDSLFYSKAYRLQFHHLTHPYFSILGVLFQARDKRQDRSDDEIMESYKWMSVYALNFLDAYLKDKAQALAFLEKEPAGNGPAKELLTMTSKPPVEKAFSFEDFNELAAAQDYTRLDQLYRSVIQKYPSFKPDENKLNNLGLQLVFNPATSLHGIKIFVLATEIYPASSNIFDSLGEAYLYTGDNRSAIKSFKRSLELNPQNQNAMNRLQELKK